MDAIGRAGRRPSAGAGVGSLDDPLYLVCTNGRHDQCCATAAAGGAGIARLAVVRRGCGSARTSVGTVCGQRGDPAAQPVLRSPSSRSTPPTWQAPGRCRSCRPRALPRAHDAHAAEQAVEHSCAPSSVSTGSTPSSSVDASATATTRSRRRSDAARPHRPAPGVGDRTTRVRRTSGQARARVPSRFDHLRSPPCTRATFRSLVTEKWLRVEGGASAPASSRGSDGSG